MRSGWAARGGWCGTAIIFAWLRRRAAGQSASSSAASTIRRKIWINDRLAGKSEADFSSPALFDLTAGLDSEGDNVLVIHIQRAGGINEIGVGGLFRPSFLYEGEAAAR